MKSHKRIVYAAVIVALFAVPYPEAGWTQHAGHHKSIKAADLKWAAVPSLPKGAQIAVIEGPLSEAVPFTVRLKLPGHYRVPPHMHPAIERVTVLTGTFHMGAGEKFDRAATHPVGVGDMMIMQPGTPHFGWTDVETVVQLHGTGPWGVTYVNAADDPRKQ